jgi:DNA polymerase
MPSRLQPVTYPELPDPLPLSGQEGLDLARGILGECQRCKLCHGRSTLVFGSGAAESRLVFVGEGPGAEEDRTGLPFVGAAGDLLTRMIAAMGLRREQVYICNVVKCRPPGNRTPEPDEIAACYAFLRAQIQAIRPQIIVALGRTPAQVLLNTAAPITRIRGTWSVWEGIPVMPTFHPAYLLRTPSAKRQVWEDLQLVMSELKKTAAAAPAPA